MTVTVTETDHDSVTYRRLDDQLGWYDRKSGENQRKFKLLKVAQMLVAAGIPVAAAVSAPGVVPAALGGAVLLLEGVQQLNQYQQNWITYRSTAEALKHEKFLYLAGVDVYADAGTREATLAQRIEGLISQEHAKWTATRVETGSKRDGS
jgi:hypothetical protein